MATLTKEEIDRALEGLHGWESRGDVISKEFDCGDFRGAVGFIVALSYEAEAVNHHPDLEVSYKRVRVSLSTHSEGGVTANDIELAGAIERLRS